MQKREKLIQLRVAETEKEIIEMNAKKHNMKVAPYIRMVSQNPNIIQEDYSAIQEHTKQIRKIVDSINLTTFTIHVQNDYQPKEIEGILAYIEEVWRTEKQLLKKLRKQWNNENKQHKG